MASVKGKLFEFFVCKLLLCCGFKHVNKDGLLIFDGSPGTMIQGLGQAHNADVLLEPPFQTPFYFSTRLLVECKCYSDTIGLPIIRNALGLRQDINSFDIVTKEILENRRLSYTTKSTSYPMKRYSYQVAVASFSGFKSTAIPFAQTHRIPLISFAESSLFTGIKNAILEVERKAIEDEEFARLVLKYIDEHQYEKQVYNDVEWHDNTFCSFVYTIRWFQERIVVGLLEDGTILFMLKNDQGDWNKEREDRYYDGCEIHWSSTTEAWELWHGDQCYSFELPKEIYNEWIESVEAKKKVAIQIKERYFSKIILFEHNTAERESIRTIFLSERFIETAKQNMDIE